MNGLLWLEGAHLEAYSSGLAFKAKWLTLIAFIIFEFAILSFSLRKIAKQVLGFLSRACELTHKNTKVFKLKSRNMYSTTVARFELKHFCIFVGEFTCSA